MRRVGYGRPHPRVASGEILAADTFYSFDAKYVNAASRTIVPADLPADVQRQVQKAAVAMFKAVDGRGMARVDFFLEDGTGKLLLNEINTVPGFTSISMYAMMWEASGVALPQVLDQLVQMALDKCDKFDKFDE